MMALLYFGGVDTVQVKIKIIFPHAHFIRYYAYQVKIVMG